MSARCVMVLGTTSGAGKSWLATALCRYYARQGLKVAPFKAQNMSNNARVVRVAPKLPTACGSLPPEGVKNNAGVGEIGSAQYFQALAARVMPDVRMNPVLLKPERDTHSQVVVMGQVDEGLSNMPWRDRSEVVWPVISQALDALVASHDVVVIEGAGSPAEINLHESDIVNMRVALHVQARCLLVTDIDRGGAFAHLYGTWALLPAPERALLNGFVLNKFRGDAALLAPGPRMLQELTGVPTVATLPMWREHGLPEEDWKMDIAPTLVAARTALPPEGTHFARGGPSGNGAPTLPHFVSSLPPVTIAIMAYPRISNLDEFQPLAHLPGVQLRWIRRAADLPPLTSSDWIVLPGSKHTSSDLAWLRQHKLDATIAAHAAQGGAVLGICGGLQMLGEALVDPHGIDGNAPGLGLLPLVTVFEAKKALRATEARFNAIRSGQASPWAALGDVTVRGYEIRHGHTRQQAGHSQAAFIARAVLPDDLGWTNSNGNVLGIYLHGLFENPPVLQALFGHTVPALDDVLEGLADFVAQHFQPGALDALIQPGPDVPSQ